MEIFETTQEFENFIDSIDIDELKEFWDKQDFMFFPKTREWLNYFKEQYLNWSNDFLWLAGMSKCVKMFYDYKKSNI